MKSSETTYRFIPGPGGKGLPGLNDMENWARTNRYKAASERKKWKDHIKRSLWLVPRFKRIWIEFLYVEPNRRRDPDNIAAIKKLLIDSLVDIGVIENDGWRQVAGWSDRFKIDDNKSNGGVGVWIGISEAKCKP